MTQKALLQSAGDGTAVPSGYVGEVIETTAPLRTASITWTSSCSHNIVLPNGVWLLTAICNTTVAGGTYSYAYLSQTLQNSGSSAIGTNGIDSIASALTSSGLGSVIIPNKPVYVPSGTTQTWYCGLLSNGTASNGWSIFLRAVRIA